MPLTTDELRNLGIYPWRAISAEFRGAGLLLGNGFSSKLNALFQYNSLFDRFLINCAPQDADRFRQFGTSNFELILESLLGTIKVDGIFAIPSEAVRLAVDMLKQGLITTVGQHHPRAIDLNPDLLLRMSEAFDDFGDIFALSYDALIYHIIMNSLDRHRDNNAIRPYNDYFWAHYNDEFLEFMDYQNYPRYKHVYYLHGAVFIFRIGANTVKIKRRGNTELLGIIEGKIRDGHFPLFVAEGTSEDKQLAISRSEYLQFAYNHLRHQTNPLVIYGASLSRQDSHIVEAIRNPDRHLALAIHVGDKLADVLRREMRTQRDKFPNQGIRFFDSETLFNLN